MEGVRKLGRETGRKDGRKREWRLGEREVGREEEGWTDRKH